MSSKQDVSTGVSAARNRRISLPALPADRDLHGTVRIELGDETLLPFMNPRYSMLLGASAALAVLALPATGIATASTPRPAQPLGTVCSAVPDGLNLLIPHTGGVVATTSAGAELLDAPIAAGPNLAVRGPDGTVWVEATPGGTFGVYRIPPGGPAELVAEGEVALTGVGWLGGRSAAAVIDANGTASPDDPDGFGAVFAAFADGARVDVSEAAGWEWGVNSATIGADRVLEKGTSEGYEWFAAYGPSGEPLDDWKLPNENQPDVRRRTTGGRCRRSAERRQPAHPQLARTDDSAQLAARRRRSADG